MIYTIFIFWVGVWMSDVVQYIWNDRTCEGVCRYDGMYIIGVCWCDYDSVDIADKLYIMDIYNMYNKKIKNYLKFNKNQGLKMALFRRSFLVASIGIIETSRGVYFHILRGFER